MKVLAKVSQRFPALGSAVSRAIDPALNVAIILMCVLIAVAFVRSSYLRSSTPADQRKQDNSQVGRKVSLEGIDWSKSEQTLLMFLSTRCSYCLKSEPFYRRLGNGITDHQKVRLVAVFPQSSEKAREYLNSARITVDETRQHKANDLRITGTPTLVLVNTSGVATNQWLGLLSPAEEAEVLSRLGIGSAQNPSAQ